MFSRRNQFKSLKLLMVALLCMLISTTAFAQKSLDSSDELGEGTAVTDGKPQPEGPLPVVDQKTTKPSTTIVGGTVADPGEYPWQARVHPSTSTIYCGGTLITTQWVVTAAHCVQGKSPSSMRVTMGDHNVTTNEGTEQVFNISQIVVHPSYNSSTQDNDIALMKLSTLATINTRVKTIPFVTTADAALFAPGVNSVVTGWGATSSGGSTSNVLREVTVPIVSNTTCNASNSYNGKITANMLCAGLAAGGKDSCQGDSGGPLIVPNGTSWKLAGVVSWGEGCASPNKYGVYARVANYTQWINGYIGGSTPTPTTTTTPTSTPTSTPTTTPTPGSIVNGGFENGTTPWVESSNGGYTIISTTRPQSGSYSAFFCGYNNCNEKIYQAVTAGSSLKYSYYISTQESGSTAYDYLRVRVYSSSGSLLGTLKTYSNASTKNTWVSETLSLSAYNGQSVRIQFEATSDSSLTSSFFIDNVQ